LQRGDEKLDIAGFGSVQLVDDPKHAMNAHGTGRGDFAQQIVASQQNAVLLAGRRDEGEAIIGRQAAIEVLETAPSCYEVKLVRT